MLLSKIIKPFLWAFIAIFLSGCITRTEYIYKCPFGVGYLTEQDYETMSSPDLISEQFVLWLLNTNEYCKESEYEI